MEENEAPEKLYVNFHFIETHPESHHPLVTKQGINKYDIEYTRTDAFIDKACGWIKENMTNNPNANSVLVRNGCVTLGMLVEDFKKYMND